MTSDGIDDPDCSVTLGLQRRVAEAAVAGDVDSQARCTRALLLHLDRLERKYGTRPSLLATRADYVEDVHERIRLLERAWRIACEMGDKRNCTLIASSLAGTFIEEAGDRHKGADWLSKLEAALAECWVDEEHEEFRRLEEMESAVRCGRNPPERKE